MGPNISRAVCKTAIGLRSPVGLALLIVLNTVRSPADTTVEQVVVTGQQRSDARVIYPDDVGLQSTLTVADALSQNVPSAVLSDTESNPFQPDLFYRGFDASPVLGSAEGLAVYENGDRINEAFGDTVLWDMVPLFAISRINVLPGSNPLLGLNALGGAVAIDMKTGFSDAGTETDFSAGSFGRVRSTVQASRQWDDDALYLGASAMHDDGWRNSSPSDLIQAYGDFSQHSGRGSFGISLSVATDRLSENAAIPVQDSPQAAFAIPDIAKDTVLFLQARGSYALDSSLTVRGDAFVRSTRIVTLNGEPSGFEPCSRNPAKLCDDDGDPLETLSGNSVPASVIGNGTLGVQVTETIEVGTTGEVEWSGHLLGLDDKMTAGVALDYAPTDFTSTTELGVLVFAPGGVTTVVPNTVYLGGDEWNIRLRTINADSGLFADNTLALTSALLLDLSGRWNLDRIDLTDRYGTELTGDHTFSAINPSARLTWDIPKRTNIYIEVGQSSRTPTAAELSCANPLLPCLFPLSFISDPGLREVIAQTGEIGASGKTDIGTASLSWLVDVFDTRNRHDIQFISAGPFIGSGYFANIGDTERRGAEARIQIAKGQVDASVAYAFVDATFRSSFLESSPYNPAANPNGEIFVVQGDRLPNIPEHTVKISLGWHATPALHLRLEMEAASGQYLRGDEANLQSELPGYAIFNAEATYALSDSISLELEAQNILDTHYATFGLYGDPTGSGTFPQFTNPRFIVPAQPFGLWAGIKAGW